MAQNSLLRSLIRTMIIAAIAKIASLIKVSCAIGSSYLFFSFRNSIVPLVGAFAGAVGAGLYFVGSAAISFFVKDAAPLSFLAYSGIPTLFSSLYWTVHARSIKAVIPALCMVLFLIHPIGIQAWPYALFWLIPFALAFKKEQSIFMTALASTFIAHAVGSVLWLYTTSMEPSYWYALIPIVPLERMLFAAGTTVCYRAFSFALNYNWREAYKRMGQASTQ